MIVSAGFTAAEEQKKLHDQMREDFRKRLRERFNVKQLPES